MKKFLKFLLKGLYSNQEIIEESKSKPFWQSLIILVISLVVAVIPLFSSIASTNGSDILVNKSAQNCSLDTSLTLFSKYLNEHNISIKINDEGKIDTTSFVLNPSEQEKDQYAVNTNGKDILYVRVVHEKDDPATEENEEIEALKKYQEMFNSGKTSLKGTASTQPLTYALISTNHFQIVGFYNQSSVVNTLDEENNVTSYAKASLSFSGEHTELKGTDLSTFYDKTQENPFDTSVQNWKTFLDKEYHGQKVRTLWTYTGFITALNVAVLLILSLVIMIISRLKSSKGEKLSYLTALKMASFASLSPAIIAIPVGFLFKAVAQISFIFIVGLRCTVLAMRAANPDQGQSVSR